MGTGRCCARNSLDARCAIYQCLLLPRDAAPCAGVPLWLIWRQVEAYSAQRYKWQDLAKFLREAKDLQSKEQSTELGVLKGDHTPDEASGTELELQANPVANYEASDAAQEGIKAELDAWFAANGQRAFDRYDLDCSGTCEI